MTWQRLDVVGPPEESVGARAGGIALGALAILLGQLLWVLLVTAVALGTLSPDSAQSTGTRLGFGALGALGLALAATFGGWLTGWYLRGRGTRPARARRLAMLTAGVTAALVLLLGLATFESWLTLPLYLVGGAAGAVLGANTGSRRVQHVSY